VWGWVKGVKENLVSVFFVKKIDAAIRYIHPELFQNGMDDTSKYMEPYCYLQHSGITAQAISHR